MSTLAAETAALASALDQVSWLRLFWAWIINKNVNWKQAEKSLPMLRAAITAPTMKEEDDTKVTDCKSLYDLATRTAPKLFGISNPIRSQSN